MASRHHQGHRVRRADARLLDGALVLRRLPRRASACESAAGAARLLRRSHLRARGQAARRVFSYELDGPRRSCLVRDIQCLTNKLQPNTYSSFQLVEQFSTAENAKGRRGWLTVLRLCVPAATPAVSHSLYSSKMPCIDREKEQII